MDSNPSGTVAAGMDVYDRNGEQMGRVTQVYRPSEALPIDNPSALTGESAGPMQEPAEIADVPDPGLSDMVVETVVVQTDDADAGEVASEPVSATGAETRDVDDATREATQVGVREMQSGRRSSSGVDTEPAANASGTGSMAQTGYVVVDYGGVLGIGRKELFIPFDAIDSADDNRVTLGVTKADAEERFQAVPVFET